MLNTPVRTTIEIDPNLLYRAKMKALQEQKTLKEIFVESLIRHLDFQKPEKNTRKTNVKIGGHNLGGIKTNLSRQEIYEDL